MHEICYLKMFTKLVYTTAYTNQTQKPLTSKLIIKNKRDMY